MTQHHHSQNYAIITCYQSRIKG